MLVRRGMGVISDYPPCPPGFSPTVAGNQVTICANPAGWIPSQLAAQQDQNSKNSAQNQQGILLLAAALGVLIFAPGAAKVLAAPLAYFGLPKLAAGLYI